MKYLKLSQFTLPVVLLFCMICFVQHANAQNEAVDKIANAMTDSLAYLKLTDAQKTQALSFNKTAAASFVQLKEKAKQDTSLKGKVLAQQVMGIMKQRNESLKKILTPDQAKLFKEHQVQQLAELQTKMMTAQLNLTDEQVPKVYAVNLKSLQELMNDAAELKASKRKMQKARNAKDLKSDASGKDKEMKKILTDEQYVKYEKNKEQMQAAMKSKMQEKKK